MPSPGSRRDETTMRDTRRRPVGAAVRPVRRRWLLARGVLLPLLGAVPLLLAGWPRPGHAQRSPPPLGLWAGGRIQMMLDGNRRFVFHEPGVQLTGVWEWHPTSDAGGVLLLNYLTVTPRNTFRNSLRFGVLWTGPDSIDLSDPVSGRRFALRRQ